jgi:uncharacterized membrane protein
MPELIQTLKAIQKEKLEERKFIASIQGKDLEEPEENGPSFEDVRRRAMGIDASGDDIVSLQGQLAAESGFGINLGLGYTRE